MKNIRTLIYILIGCMIGVPLGSATATFLYADGLSYLSKDPRACTNCHVMQSQYDSWQSSSHHTVATCNECHSHGTIIEKYIQKGVNGLAHSWAFTTGIFHEPIRIKNFNLKIVQKNCFSCHDNLIQSSQFGHSSFDNKNCLNCHKEVGHRK